jgi:hypothetical protein
MAVRRQGWRTAISARANIIYLFLIIKRKGNIFSIIKNV